MGEFSTNDNSRCPNCGSEDIYGDGINGYGCRDCGEEWGGQEEGEFDEDFPINDNE